MVQPDTMKALFFDGHKVFLNTSSPRPGRQAGEVLVKIELAGICDTDVQIVSGYMGFQGVLGHEFVGQVVQADDPALIGARVVAEINSACGSCAWCVRGEREHCPERTVLGIMGQNGVMAEFAVLKQATLHRVPAEVRSEQAVFTEPLAAALEIPERVHVRPTERVLVLGDGKLGSLIAQVLSLTGCELTVLGRHQAKLDLLQSVCPSLSTAISATELPPGGFDLVIEATGRGDGLVQALTLTRPRGTLLLKSTVAERAPLDLNSIVINELNLIGSRCGPFEPALRLLAAGLINTEILIEAVYPLTQGEAAFARAQQKGVRKILLDTQH